MKKICLTLFFALILCASASAQNFDVIEPALQEVLNQKSGELTDIHIYFKTNVDTDQLKNKSRKSLSKSEQKEFVVELLKAHSESNQADVMSILKAEEMNGNVADINALWIVNSISCKASRDVIYKISSHPDVKMIGYDKEIQMITPEQMKEVECQTKGALRGPAAHVVTVNADDVWTLGYTGRNVVVAVLDSGTNPKHKDLEDHLWRGYVDTNKDGVPDKFVNGWNFIANNSDITDDYGHGTHCAGIVCGDGSSGTTSGVAPDVSLMTVKTINRAGGGSVAQMLNGVQFAAENGAQVLSMSLGYKNSQITKEQKEDIRKAFDNLLELGVVVCAAVGNDGNTYGAPDNVDYPAACPAPWSNPDQTLKGGLSSVIAVGAHDLKESSVGPSTWEGTSYNDYAYNEGESMGLIRPDITAPGYMVYSSNYLYVDKYQLKSGTSQATPCVAGVIALMLEKNPSLTPAEISQILEETASNKPEKKNNTVGAGHVDALAAVNAVKEGEGTPFLKLVSYSPSIVSNENTTISISINNEGKGATDMDATATLSLQDDPYITIAEPTQTISRIGGGGDKSIYFDINIDENVPSGHVANLILTTVSGDKNWEDKFSIKVSMEPNVVIKAISPSYIKRNGTTEIGVTMINNGNAPLTDSMVLTLSTISNDLKFLTIVDDTDTIEPLGVGEIATGTFTLTTNESTSDGYLFDLFIGTFSESHAPGSYTYGFEDGLNGWTCFNASRNTNIRKPWWNSSEALQHEKEAGVSHTGDKHIMSEAKPSMTGSYTYPIDNYLVSPKIKVTEDSKISFYARPGHLSYYAEHFGLAISTNGNTSANDFNMVQEWIIEKAQGITWKEFSVDLSEYAGQEIYVAIRHFFTDQEWIDTWEGYDVETLNIDDIMLSNVLINTQHVPTYNGDDVNYFNVAAAGSVVDMPKVENLKATADSIATINLSWDKVDNAVRYNIYRDGNKIANVTGTTYTDTELPAKTKYCYNVTAVKSISESIFSDNVYVTTLSVEGVSVPEAPVATAETLSSSEIKLTWNTVEYAAAYSVYQNNMVIESGLTDTTFTVTGLKAETQYRFNVTAINEVGESEKSADVYATTEQGDIDEPIIPGDSLVPNDTLVLGIPVVTAQALSISEIKLTWNAVENALSYNVYQDTVEIKSGLTDTTFTVIGLEYDKQYCFYVVAVNDTVESVSAQVCIKTLGENIEEYNTLLINVYPNPVGDELFLATELRVEEIAIYDIYGRLCSTDASNASISNVSVRDLNSGIYFINIKTENGNVVKRFVKK